MPSMPRPRNASGRLSEWEQCLTLAALRKDDELAGRIHTHEVLNQQVEFAREKELLDAALAAAALARIRRRRDYLAQPHSA